MPPGDSLTIPSCHIYYGSGIRLTGAVGEMFVVRSHHPTMTDYGIGKKVCWAYDFRIDSLNDKRISIPIASDHPGNQAAVRVTARITAPRFYARADRIGGERGFEMRSALTRIDFGSAAIAAVLFYGYGKLVLIAAGVL